MLQLLCLTSLFAPHQRAFLRTRAARLCIQADTPLSRCSERLLFSADAIVAAAAVQMGNQGGAAAPAPAQKTHEAVTDGAAPAEPLAVSNA